MFDKLKNWFSQEPKVSTPLAAAPTKSATEPKAKSRTKAPEKTAKELATERGEPYVAILSLDVNPENLHEGAFELDWNEKFVANLVRAGYMLTKEDTDDVIVDRWFQTICRHVVMETWEQAEAMNPGRYVRERNIGDGRTEIS
jgi:hypothetical protein